MEVVTTKTRLNNVSYQQKTKSSRKRSTQNSKKLNANLKCLYQKLCICDGGDFFVMVVMRLAPVYTYTNPAGGLSPSIAIRFLV
jgi:hypothetical protein